MHIVSLRRAFMVLLALCLLSSWASAAGTNYHGNSQSRIFHKSTCRFYDCAKCTVVLQSREAAVDAGFRPCKVCRP